MLTRRRGLHQSRRPYGGTARVDRVDESAAWRMRGHIEHEELGAGRAGKRGTFGSSLLSIVTERSAVHARKRRVRTGWWGLGERGDLVC